MPTCKPDLGDGHWEGDDAEPSLQMMETWMVMEFCNKGTLSDAVARGCFRAGSGINYDHVLATGRDIACAMQYLHSRDVMHGDLTGEWMGWISLGGVGRGISIGWAGGSHRYTCKWV